MSGLNDGLQFGCHLVQGVAESGWGEGGPEGWVVGGAGFVADEEEAHWGGRGRRRESGKGTNKGGKATTDEWYGKGSGWCLCE